MTATQEHVTPAELVSHFRMMAHQYFPYLSPYVYSLVPVERAAVETMAVDMYGRMYYNPDFCTKLTLEQGAYVVLHESLHLILRHCHRAESIIGKSPTAKQRYLYNIAVDLVVWEMMEAMAEYAPGDCVTWAKMKAKYPKLERNMLPGEIYAIIAEEEAPSPRQEPQVHKQDEEDDSAEQEQQQEQAEQDTDEQAEQEVEVGIPVEREDDSTPTPDDGDAGEPDDGGSESPTDADDSQGPGESRGSGGQDGPAGDAEADGEEVDEDFTLIGGGSAADGQPRDYEEEPNPNWDAFIEDQLLEAVEKKIQEEESKPWSPGRGTIPGQLKETIRRKLRPQPNPWDVLRASVARAALNPRGAKDYTYQRVNRRQFAMANAPKLKGDRKYAPKAVVVIDTSGSMTTECKRKCIEVMAQGLQAVGEFHVIFGDTRVRADVKFTHLKNEVEMPGGGGTDMRVLIAHAEKVHKPDVIVIGTDGGTPWPDKPTKAQLVVALTQEVHTPAWATRVRIPDNPKKDEV